MEGLECGKHLFDTDLKSLGAIGAETQQRGHVYKIASLFSDTYNSLFFCDGECAKTFYQKHIPSNPEVTAKIEAIKKDIPKMAKEVSDKIAKLVEVLTKNCPKL